MHWNLTSCFGLAMTMSHFLVFHFQEELLVEAGSLIKAIIEELLI